MDARRSRNLIEKIKDLSEKSWDYMPSTNTGTRSKKCILPNMLRRVSNGAPSNTQADDASDHNDMRKDRIHNTITKAVPEVTEVIESPGSPPSRITQTKKPDKEPKDVSKRADPDIGSSKQPPPDESSSSPPNYLRQPEALPTETALPAGESNEGQLSIPPRESVSKVHPVDYVAVDARVEDLIEWSKAFIEIGDNPEAEVVVPITKRLLMTSQTPWGVPYSLSEWPLIQNIGLPPIS
ncbi:hypothetical protein PG994_004930 [Apiospora phragmitis]|uniref:Uncharacterized protein n=1 Tax=Apiospora phragmitis TaxID=2905665 RepID=A0ABR1VUN7_9PEZI